MAGGRPTKLDADILQKAQDHLNSFDVSIHTLLPTIEGLALELKISRDTVYDWEKIPSKLEDETAEDYDNRVDLHRQFSYIVNELRARQAQKLMQNSLMGRYNPTIAKLILSGKHGYVEKSEQDVTSGGNAISPVLVKFVGDDTKSD